MTLREILDRSGCSLTLLELDGKLFPAFPLDELTTYRSLRMRDDDVILCAYPKSGTHWIWEVTMMLLQKVAETIPYKKSLQMIEFNASKLGDFPSPRVLNTHMTYDALPAEALARRTRIVLVLRNPKDVAVSLYHHHVRLTSYYGYQGVFGDWLQLFLHGTVDYGSWFDYVKSWEKVLASDVTSLVHVIMYEDMKEDPVKETHRLAVFLGVTPDPELIHRVADKCQFAKMAADKRQHQETADVMFRKGVVGDWKNTLTVQQNEAFDAIFLEQMKDSNFRFRFTL